MPMSPHRLAMAGFLIALATAVLVPAAAFAAPGDTTPVPSSSATATPTPKPIPVPKGPLHPIVARAMKDDGTWGGQCYTWVQAVVKDALGKQIGNDYHKGYLEAGAIEITLELAGQGDIIQVADDNYTEPDADYPGLHTFIVTEALGKGVFNGIDSNANYTEMVAFRYDYEPRKMAARYPNLSVRVYRFATKEFPAPRASDINVSSVAPRAKALRVGDKATVVAGGDSLNLRAGPGSSHDVITQLPDGTAVTVTSEPVNVGGRQWVQVASTAGDGWVASEFLSRGVGASASAGGGGRPLFSYRSVVVQVAGGQ